MWRASVLLVWCTACTVPEECGPSQALVTRVLDGDTIELASGERVRYLLVDAPELDGRLGECHSARAFAENRRLVEHRVVELEYDPVECTDRYGRLLAYVRVGGRDVSSTLIEQGHACVLHLPPSGDDRVAELALAERHARAERRGLWGECAAPPCGE